MEAMLKSASSSVRAKSQAPSFGRVSPPVRKRVQVDQLVVYPQVQRIPPTKKLVRDIVDAFDVNALGVLTVSERKDGTYSLIDGQRRTMALKELGMATSKVDCQVFAGLSEGQEAALFRRLNRTRIVGAFDDFDKGVIEGDPVCVGIANVCRKYGWKVTRGASAGGAACVAALLKVWHMDKCGELLGKAVGALNSAFGRDKNTMSAHMVMGMARFLARDSVDVDVLIQKLQAKFASPVSVIATARTRQESERGTMETNVAAVIDRVYNSRRKRA